MEYIDLNGIENKNVVIMDTCRSVSNLDFQGRPARETKFYPINIFHEKCHFMYMT